MTPQITGTNNTGARPVLWHALGSDAVFAGLSSGPGGLSAAEASRRLSEAGPNELSFAGATPWWRVLLRQFISPLIGILLAAAVVTLFQQHWVDSGAIFLILCLNAALGFVQERKAEADVGALQSLSTRRAGRSGAASNRWSRGGTSSPTGPS